MEKFHVELTPNVPLIFIEGRKLAVVSMDISYRTKTELEQGTYTMVVSGYFPENRELSFLNGPETFEFNLNEGE